jgi:NlpC/P60 family putative phage cell wall peptidase
MEEWRKRVVDEAMTWVGTPYHHLADVKGHGVDCAMILVRIFCNLGHAPEFDPRPYAPQWFLNQGEERYLEWIKKYCDPVEVAQPADIALYRIGRCAAHGAVVISDSLMVHAYLPSGCVELKERWAPLQHCKLDSIWTVRNPKK